MTNRYVLQQISEKEMDEMLSDAAAKADCVVRGIPMYFCVTEGSLILFPFPEKGVDHDFIVTALR